MFGSAEGTTYSTGAWAVMDRVVDDIPSTFRSNTGGRWARQHRPGPHPCQRRPVGGYSVDVEPKGTLHVRGENFEVQVAGTGAFVERAWDAIKTEIVDAVRAAQTPADVENDDTSPQATPADFVSQPFPGAGPGAIPQQIRPVPGYVWIVVRHELYQKVHVQQRAALSRSPLGKLVDATRLYRVYVARSDRAAMQALFPFGDTAWSELTPHGKTQLGGGKQ